MAAFEYTALDVAGKTRSGVVSADSERAARQALASRKLVPIKLAPAKAKAEAERPGAAGLFRPRFGAKRLALVTRQLATLISVAPLEEALRTLALQAEDATARRVLLATHGLVVEGYRLSDAMGRQGPAFPPLYRAMVAAGESSGALPQILERLADLLEREQEVRAKLTTALVYPAALAVTALVVIVALLTFVVPKVVEQFETIGQELPLLTRIVIGVSEGFQAFGWLGVLGLLLGGLLFVRALQTPAFRKQVDGAALKAPLVGRVLRDVHAARMARTLATMLQSGLPLLEGLTITARTVRNVVLRDATEDMAAAIREGGSLSAAMRRAGVFPPILVYMTASGEESGRLDVMLARAADYLEREFNAFTAMALSLLEPAIIVFMGGVVACIVLAVLLPILQINTLAFG